METEPMSVRELKIHIRLARLDLGQDPDAGLPNDRGELTSILKALRVEQAYSQKSAMRPEIKERIRQSRNDAARAFEASLPDHERASAAEFAMRDI
jgi:hypothetical protein